MTGVDVDGRKFVPAVVTVSGVFGGPLPGLTEETTGIARPTLTVTAGDADSAVNEPPAVDFSVVENTAVPVPLCAVAPSEAVQAPPEVAPYVTVTVPAPASVNAETLIVCPENDNVPAEVFVHPATFAAEGAVQPAGTEMSSSPELVPPDAAVYVNVNVFPVDAADTAVGDTAFEPEPSAAAEAVHCENSVTFPATVNVSAGS